MSKFFIQMLLSLFVGIGAVVGFRADLRADVKHAFHDAKVTVRETASMAFQSVGDVMHQVTASVSPRVSTKAAAESNTKANLKTKGNVEIQTSNGGTLLNNVVPQISVNDSSTVNSQSNMNANTQAAQLDLTNKTKSTLDLSVDPLK